MNKDSTKCKNYTIHSIEVLEAQTRRFNEEQDD